MASAIDLRTGAAAQAAAANAGQAPAAAAPAAQATQSSSAPTRVVSQQSAPPRAADVIEITSRAPAAPAPAEARPILFFDGNCKVCGGISRWVIKSDARGGDHIDERPIGHDPVALAKLNPNLDIWKMYEAVHVLLPDGTIKTGGQAIAEVLKRLPQTRLAARLLDVSLFGWKPFQKMLDGAYYILDNIRPALGCTSCGRPVPWWGKPVAWVYNMMQPKAAKAE